MADPVTLGAIVALLVAKATDRTAGEVVDGGAEALGRLVGWLRGRFSDDGDEVGSAALAQVEEVPDSPSRINALAEVLNQRAKDVEGFRAALEDLVAKAESAGVNIGAIKQKASGCQVTQIGGVVNSDVRVSHSGPPPMRDL
jgi:hypothetical protein